jgi:methionyl-tRNA synthetase
MEYIQADIWVRHQRMQGHGALRGRRRRARRADHDRRREGGQDAAAVRGEIAAGRKEYLDGFHIRFDNWHSTDSAGEHRAGAAASTAT